MTVHQPIDVALDRVLSDVQAIIEPRRSPVAARARPSWARRLASAWLLTVGAALGAGGAMLVRPPAPAEPPRAPVREVAQRGGGPMPAASSRAAPVVVAQAPPPTVDAAAVPAAALPSPPPFAAASPIERPSPRAVADARPRAPVAARRRVARRAVASAPLRVARPAALPAPAMGGPYRRAPDRYAAALYEDRYDGRPAWEPRRTSSRDDRRLTRAVNREELERVRDEIEDAERDARPRRRRRSLRDIFGL